MVGGVGGWWCWGGWLVVLGWMFYTRISCTSHPAPLTCSRVHGPFPVGGVHRQGRRTRGVSRVELSEQPRAHAGITPCFAQQLTERVLTCGITIMTSYIRVLIFWTRTGYLRANKNAGTDVEAIWSNQNTPRRAMASTWTPSLANCMPVFDTHPPGRSNSRSHFAKLTSKKVSE